MRQRKIKNLDEKLESLSYLTVDDGAALKGKWRSVFPEQGSHSDIAEPEHGGAEEPECAGRPLFAEFGLEGTQKKYPHQLSGGMRQRAAFLRTYLFSGEAALLDEPFSALDTMTKGDMHKWYLGVMEKLPVSTLFITHDIDEAITLSDRVYILSGKPGTITGEVKIDCPKNERKDFALTGDFLEYKKQILGLLGRK